MLDRLSLTANYTDIKQISASLLPSKSLLQMRHFLEFSSFQFDSRTLMLKF